MADELKVKYLMTTYAYKRKMCDELKFKCLMTTYTHI